MQKLAIPRGRMQFSEPFSRIRPREVQTESYLRTVYSNSDDFMSAVRGIAKMPPAEIMRAMEKDMRAPSEIAFDYGTKVDSVSGLRRLSDSFERGRNARIAYFLAEPFYARFFKAPYQLVCQAIASARVGESEKEIQLTALGVFGNLLPKDNKAELGRFLADYLKEAESPILKADAILALAMLHSEQGIGSIRRAAEGLGERPEYSGFGVLAQKAELLIVCANPEAGRLSGVLPGFLMGNFGSRVKADTARLMRSMNSLEMTSKLLAYLGDVEGTIAYIAGKLAPKGPPLNDTRMLSVSGRLFDIDSALIYAMDNMPGSGAADDIAAYLMLAPEMKHGAPKLAC